MKCLFKANIAGLSDRTNCIAIADITIMFTIDYVNNTIWTPTLRDDYSCYPARMCPTEGTTRYDRESRNVPLEY